VLAVKAPAKKVLKAIKAIKKPLPVVKTKAPEKSKKVAPIASEQILNKAKNLVDQKNTKNKADKTEVAKKTSAAPAEVEVPRIQSKAFKENLAKLRAISKVNDYSMVSRYNVGDKLMHSKFGLGEVIDCIEYNKISVHFESGDKILIHNDNRNSLTN
jgi:hypothetical protein